MDPIEMHERLPKFFKYFYSFPYHSGQSDLELARRAWQRLTPKAAVLSAAKPANAPQAQGFRLSRDCAGRQFLFSGQQNT